MTAVDVTRHEGDGSTRRAPVFVAAAHVLLGLLFLSPSYIRPDSVAVYSYLRSAVIDHDLLFFDEWAGFGMIGDGFAYFKEVTPVGALANHWWIGASILCGPFYLVAFLVSLATDTKIDGFFGLFLTTLAWSSVLFAAVTCLLGDALLRRLGFELRGRVFAIASIWLGTPLFWYEYRFPLGTHAPAAMMIALLTLLLYEALEGESDAASITLTGIIFGMAIVTRLQHFVLGGAILYVLARRRLWRLSPYLFAGCILPLATQAAAWQIIYGHPLGPLVRGANATGVTWMPFQNVALGAVLFSSFHGLLPWSPVIAIALIGLAMAMRSPQRPLAVMLILMIAGEWVANGCLDRYWWGGMSFGGRRFLDLAVPFMIGAAFVLRAKSILISTLTGLCVVWSLLLVAGAISGHLPLENDTTPTQLLQTVMRPRIPSLQDLHSPLVNVGGQAAAGLVLVALTASGLFLIFRDRRRLLLISALYLGFCTIVVILAAGNTRSRAGQEQLLLGLRPELRDAGPLLDQRKLISAEIPYLLRTGDELRAAARRDEIRAIDQRLRSFTPSRSGP